MSSDSTLRMSAPVALTVFSIRNITSPEDSECGRKVYVGQIPIGSIIDLSTDENVRDYLLSAEGKKRKVPTQIHKAIEETLRNSPENFSVLNGGLVIVARDCNISDKDKKIELTNPSIINGSQTQGIIKDYISGLDDDSRADALRIHIKFELIVTSDEDLIADVSIARNFQNDVMTLSIAGRLGQLDELQEAFQQSHSSMKLQKSETMLSEDYVKTEKLLQIISALVPSELAINTTSQNKVYTYNQKTKCLREFQEIHKRAKDPESKDHSKYKELYQFYLDMAGSAWDLYEVWKKHHGFVGTRLRSIERNNGEIINIPDGIVFPILASHSVFARKIEGKWKISRPDEFDDSELIKAAVSVYQEIANSTPHIMGKTKACYTQLQQITEIFDRFSRK